VLIGHNPGLSELAGRLAAPPVTDNGPRPAISLPTAAIAILEFSGDWPSLAPGQARLVSLITPADL
jgi:phosphohistidine phosphatase